MAGVRCNQCGLTTKSQVITEERKKFGYFVKPSKSWLILKCENQALEAEQLFMGTPIKITTNGKRHLGATIGTNGFKNDYMQEKVSEWCSKLKVLSKMAHSNPQTAYAAYIFGEQVHISTHTL